MNTNIRENVINNIKEENSSSIFQIIEESVNNNDEISLPGMGVLLEIFWNNSTKEEKEKLCIIIEKGLNN